MNQKLKRQNLNLDDLDFIDLKLDDLDSVVGGQLTCDPYTHATLISDGTPTTVNGTPTTVNGTPTTVNGTPTTVNGIGLDDIPNIIAGNIAAGIGINPF